MRRFQLLRPGSGGRTGGPGLRCVLALLVSFAIGVPSAAAQEDAREGRRRADALHFAGVEMMEAGRPDSAAALLGGAARLGGTLLERGFAEPSLPEMLYWTHRLRGIAWTQAGRPDSAVAGYLDALRFLPFGRHREGEAELSNYLGVMLLDRGLADSARVFLRRGLEASRRANLPEIEVNVLLNLGVAWETVPDSSLAYLDGAMAVARELGDDDTWAHVARNAALVRERTGDRAGALRLLEGALEVARRRGDREAEGGTLYRLGAVLLATGARDSAGAVYRRALARLPAEGPARADRIAVLLDLGQIDLLAGRPDSAIHRLRGAAEAAAAIGVRALEARARLQLGAVYSGLARHAPALAEGRRAVALAAETQDAILLGEALGALSRAFWMSGMADSSLVGLEAAVRAVRGRGAPNLESSFLGSLAAVRFMRGERQAAAGLLEEALRIEGIASTPGARGQLLHDLAFIEASSGRPERALALTREALALARAASNRELEAGALAGAARLYAAPPFADAERALAHFDSAAAAYASIERRAGQDPNRVAFAERTVDLHGEWALAWLRFGAAGDGAAAALAVSERGRAQALLDLMRRTAGEAGAGDAGLRRVAAVGADLVAEGRRLAGGVAAAGTGVLLYRMVRDTLLTWLVSATGEIEARRSPLGAAALAGEVAALRAGMGVEAAARARLATRGAEALATRPPPGAALDGAPGEPVGPRGRGLEGEEEGTDGDWTRAAGRLAAALLPSDLAERLSPGGDLVVVPEGPLALVPFATLPADAGTAGADAGEPLGVRYALRYAPSLATLLGAEERPPGDPRADPLVAGDPAMPPATTPAGERVELAPLPGARLEAEWVAERLGTTAILGRRATEAEVTARLAAAGLVHLATHGYAYGDPERGRDSFLALAASGEEDGLLTVADVLDGPTLSAELVVLSACQTGLGDIRRAEGTVGLQRAFLARGARTLLVSLWSVSDEATRLLVQRFYAHWLGDSDDPAKAEALRRAQRDVRATPGYEHPRYWAAFQLVGAS